MKQDSSRSLLIFCLISISHLAYSDAVGAPDGKDTRSQFDYRSRMARFDPQGDAATLSKSIAQEYAVISTGLGMRNDCSASHATSQLQALWDVSEWASFYTTENVYLAKLKACFRELERRQAVTSFIGLRTFKALVRHREFDEARSIVNAHPSINFPHLPTLTKGGSTASPEVIDVTEFTPAKFVRRSIEIDRHRTILVVASAGCQFAERAAIAIKSDPELMREFEDAIWIAPPNDLLMYKSIQRWNSRYPFAPVSVAYSPSGFKGLDLTRSPIFYLLDQGIVVNQLIGWDESKNPVSALKRLLIRPR